MIYYVAADAFRNGDGSKERPFSTINEAAQIACPGDEVLVAPGLYREYVNPKYAGREDARITYRSIEPLGAVISGSEVVNNWEPFDGNVWTAAVPNSVFGDYNPYTTIVEGDWYNAPKPVHTGMVYLNGKGLYEAFSVEEVKAGEVYAGSWDPEGTIYKWFAEQKDDCTVFYANFQGKNPNEECVEINVRRNCFYPDRTGIGYITLSGFGVKQAATQWAPPTAYQEGMVGPHWSKGWIIEDCEISWSRCSGISLGKYLQPNNENKWIKKYYKHGTQTERDAICQAQYEGWSKETIGSHIVRRCNIHDCGQTGIVGHLGCVFSLIEDNNIHHINNMQDLAGAEIGGIKFHAAIDTTIRRNHFHHCTRGVWLDWQAQGTRVSQNLFDHNIAPEGTDMTQSALAEDLFVEVSHGPTLIDNNIFLSNIAGRLATQGLAFVHNLIFGSFVDVGAGTDNGAPSYACPRYTPYHVPHRTEVAGFMTFLHGDARFYNNIFVQQAFRADLVKAAEAVSADAGNGHQFVCGTKPYDGYPTEAEYKAMFDAKTVRERRLRDMYYSHLPVWTGGNVYFNGALPYDKELNFKEDKENKITWELKEENGKYTLETNLFDYLPVFNTQVVTTELLGEAFEPEQLFENPDGTPIIFNEDYFGKHRGLQPLAGPFADKEDAKKVLF